MRSIQLSVAFSMCVLATGRLAAVSFTPLGDLPGSIYRSEAEAVSGNGKVVVGTSSSAIGTEAFRWSAETGMVGLGNVPEAPDGSLETSINDVSFDGSVIVGSVLTNRHSDDRYSAGFRWTRENGMTTLIDRQLGILHDPTAVSADGTTIVGNKSIERRPAFFRWREGEPTVVVQHPEFDPDFFEADVVSADGSTIYGNSGIFGGCCGLFKWEESSGVTFLDNYEAGIAGFGVSATDVFSNGFIGNAAGGGGGFCSLGFRWTEGVGFERLSFIDQGAGLAGDVASGISADGRVIVGATCSLPCPFEEHHVTSAIWDETHGWRSVEQILIDNGIDLTGWNLSVHDVSDDGRIIMGNGRNPRGHREAWLADLSNPTLLPGDYNADNVVDQGDLNFVLMNWGADASTPPDGWIRNLPSGRIDQAELNDVLLTWGSTQGAMGSFASVPEPSSLVITFLVASLVVACGKRAVRLSSWQ